MANIKGKPKLETAAAQVEFLKKKLGYVTFSRPPQQWMKTGSKNLNAVIGSKDLGFPYGKILTLAGKQSSGKSLLALRLMGKAQQDGATVGWVDIENSFDADFSRVQGLDCGEAILDENGGLTGYSKIALFQPELGVFGKSGREKAKERKNKKKATEDKKVMDLEERQQTAEQLFELVKKWLLLQRKINPSGKVALAVDSTTAIQPEEELLAGLVDQNMRTRLSLASFLNQLTKDLVNLSLNTNCFVTLISQLRTNPTKVFQNPDYVPGGNGVLFYPSSICWMRRVANITKGGTNVGLSSIIVNKKNKCGGGSVEGGECGIKMFYGSQDDWKFCSVDEIKRKD